MAWTASLWSGVWRRIVVKMMLLVFPGLGWSVRCRLSGTSGPSILNSVNKYDQFCVYFECPESSMQERVLQPYQHIQMSWQAFGLAEQKNTVFCISFTLATALNLLVLLMHLSLQLFNFRMFWGVAFIHLVGLLVPSFLMILSSTAAFLHAATSALQLFSCSEPNNLQTT